MAAASDAGAGFLSGTLVAALPLWSSHKLPGALRDPPLAYKHPGARLIGVAWCLGIIAWSLLIALLCSSRAPQLTPPPRRQ